MKSITIKTLSCSKRIIFYMLFAFLGILSQTVISKPVMGKEQAINFLNLERLCDSFEDRLKINQNHIELDEQRRKLRQTKKIYERTTPSSRISDDELFRVSPWIQYVIDESLGFDEIVNSKFLQKSFCDLVFSDETVEHVNPQVIEFFQKFAELYVLVRLDRNELANEISRQFQEILAISLPDAAGENHSSFLELLYKDLSPRYQVFLNSGATYTFENSWNFEDVKINKNLKGFNPQLYQALKEQLTEQSLKQLLNPSRREAMFLNGQYALPPRREQDTRRPEMIGRIEFYSQERYLRNLSREFTNFERAVKGFLKASDETGEYNFEMMRSDLRSFWGLGQERRYQGKTAAEIELESHWQQALKSFDRLNYIYGISAEQQKQLLGILDLMKHKEIENLDLAEKSIDDQFFLAFAAPLLAPVAWKFAGVTFLGFLAADLGLSAISAYQESLESPVQEEQSFVSSYLNVINRDAPRIFWETSMWTGIAKAFRWGGMGISKAGYAKTGERVAKYGEWGVVVPMIVYEFREIIFAGGDQGPPSEAQVELGLNSLDDPCDLERYEYEDLNDYFELRVKLCEEVKGNFSEGFPPIFQQRAYQEITAMIDFLYSIKVSPTPLPRDLVHKRIRDFRNTLNAIKN